MCRVILLIMALLGGCATPPHRAAQYETVFDTLTQCTQERLLRRSIQIGDTREMVYIAIGSPQSQQTLPHNKQGERWDYLGYVDDDRIGEQAQVSYRTRNDFVWLNPFDSHSYQRIIIDFVDNAVIAIHTQTADKPIVRGRAVTPMRMPQSLP